MALDKDTAKKVLAQIDRDELAQLGCDLTSIPSPTGQDSTGLKPTVSRRSAKTWKSNGRTP